MENFKNTAIDLFFNLSETYLDIPGYEGLYQVSNMGNVRSLARKVWSGKHKKYVNIKGKLLKLNDNGKGYHTVTLSKFGKLKPHKVHRLVMLAFEGEAPLDKKYVNHIDGNKTNNSIDNLEYVSSSENLKHAFATGLKSAIKGEDNVLSVLDDNKVRFIRDRFDGGASILDLAKVMRLKESTVRNVVENKTWAHLPACTRKVNRHHLTAEDVAIIRSMHKTGEYTQKEIGLEFGVHQGCISSIVRGKTWA